MCGLGRSVCSVSSRSWVGEASVIYDNATESDLLLRSLQRALNKDKASRRITDPNFGHSFRTLRQKTTCRQAIFTCLGANQTIPLWLRIGLLFTKSVSLVARHQKRQNPRTDSTVRSNAGFSNRSQLNSQISMGHSQFNGNRARSTVYSEQGAQPNSR